MQLYWRESSGDPLVKKQAEWQTPANLGDLRTATPFTYTLTVSATECVTDPETVTVSWTWFVQGTPFTAENNPPLTFSANGYYYFTYTFPGMTVTSLTRGEQITLVEPTQRTSLTGD